LGAEEALKFLLRTTMGRLVPAAVGRIRIKYGKEVASTGQQVAAGPGIVIPSKRRDGAETGVFKYPFETPLRKTPAAKEIPGQVGFPTASWVGDGRE